jgi:hypothetical protein
VIQIPHGCFKANLTVGDIVEEVSGFVYQDHNWGNVPAQDVVTDSIWGHFCNESYTVIFSRLITLAGSYIDRNAIIEHHTPNIIMRPKMQTGYLELLSDANLAKFTSKVRVDFPEVPVTIQFELREDRLLRRWIDNNFDSYNASYCRWATMASGTIEQSYHELRGVTEYLRIRRKAK